jgi:thiol-disulfide isomerase/thioredoxin
LHRPTKEFLQIAAANNPDRAARGFATFALALLTKQKAESMAFFEIAPSSIYTNAAFQKTKANYQEEAKAADSRTLLHQADQMFETVIEKFADCPNFPPGPGLREPKPTLGDQAGVELYECRHLEPGIVAPEIEGEDIDGRKFKLSEYRGRVVVLDFWASWCGPCMQMVPHERAMAQRLKGKPFALVGVNADEVKAAAKRAVAKENMTWRSFWNGGGSESGIAATWNVHGWPMIYVLDPKGTIRFKQDGYGGKRSDALLDELVDRLLKEIETGKQ